MKTVTLMYNYGPNGDSLHRTTATLTDENIARIESFMDQNDKVEASNETV